MNRRRYILCSLATGIIVVTVWSLLVFWGRWICWSALAELTFPRREAARISPLKLLPDAVEYDPNVVVHSQVTMTVEQPYPCVRGLGLADDMLGRVLQGRPSDVLIWERQFDGTWAHVDRGRGLIVYSGMERESKNSPEERIWLYAGPQGVAETPSKEIGRFHRPVAGCWGEAVVVFDSELQRFFRVSFESRHVMQGPELDLREPYEPVQIGDIVKHYDQIHLSIEPPLREMAPEESDQWHHAGRQHDGKTVVPVTSIGLGSWSGRHALVLDAPGRLNQLDVETLELTGWVGSLSGIPDVFTRLHARSKSKSLSDYIVLPVRLPNGTSPEKWEHVGCLVGALSYDGSQAGLVVYDREGMRVGSASRPLVASAGVSGGPLISTIRFGLENLHSPALSLLSYFTARYCPAGSGYRSVFVQPDSLIAKKGRDWKEQYILRFIEAIVLIAPGILLAGVFSTLVARRAGAMGFSADARLAWRVATLAFGLPAYLAYRLTEPRIRLVTCRNCGRVRRPDQDRCHHCRSLWEVPELVAPSWRVLDRVRERPSEPSPAPEAGPPEAAVQ